MFNFPSNPFELDECLLYFDGNFPEFWSIFTNLCFSPKCGVRLAYGKATCYANWKAFTYQL